MVAFIYVISTRTGIDWFKDIEDLWIEQFYRGAIIFDYFQARPYAIKHPNEKATKKVIYKQSMSKSFKQNNLTLP